MNSRLFKSGDILEATERSLKKGKHYIIYYDGYSNSKFIGGMITHLESNLNKAMLESHFLQKSENDEQYKIVYDNTYLVLAKLIKFESWGPFEKVGSLTDVGFQFVKKNIENLEEETFSNYYRKTKTST